MIEFDAYGGPGWDGLLVDPLEVKDGFVQVAEVASPGLGVGLGLRL